MTAQPSSVTPSSDPAGGTTLTTPLSAFTPPTVTTSPGTAPVINRLTKIEIENYRAYRGSFRIDLPKGENLLVYGENGAGKSSLYHTLRVFFEAPGYQFKDTTTGKWRSLAVTDHRHRFIAKAPTIKLEFGTHSFQWTETINETVMDPVRLLNQGKGFLDYKALLEVHYYRFDEGVEIDLFQLLIRRLLPYYTYPSHGQNVTFQDAWKRLKFRVQRRWYGAEGIAFSDDLLVFNDALERTVNDLGVRASEMLTSFGDEFAVGFHFEKAEFKTGPKRIIGPRILARPAFRKQQVPDYHGFFNEARLSALAICLFFAALKDSPATGLRILALDDVLIGLDMANRLTVLELVNKHFCDWQVLIFTYSKAWFELMKERIKLLGRPADWKNVVLWEEWREEDNSPHIVASDSGDMIQMAASHLQHKDFKAAAVYARSALEACCHHTCARAALPIPHVDDPRKRTLEDYLPVIEKRLSELKDDARRGESLQLIARVRQARAFVLNKKSHFDIEEEDTLTAEVGASIQIVKDVDKFLSEQSWKHGQFKHGKTISADEQMIIELAEARKLAAFNQYSESFKKLALAHQFAWETYGKRNKICLPIGETLSAKIIWDAALAQSKLDTALDARLKAARPYLFGSVEDKDFDAAKFEEAARLLEEIALKFV